MLLKTVAKNIGIAVIYYFLAHLSLLLHADQGNATILWPAAGFAVAVGYLCGYRVLFGVFLGAAGFAFSLGLANQNYDDLFLLCVRSVLMGMWPCMQAGISTFLLYSLIGKKSCLDEIRAVLIFGFIDGPVCCVFSATFSFFTLLLFGIVPWSAFISFWLTWYVGDVLGVLVFAPLLIIAVRPKTEVSLARKLQVAVPMICVFFAVLALYEYARKEQVNGVHADLNGKSNFYSKVIDWEMEKVLTMVRNFETLVRTDSSAQEVDVYKYMNIFMDNLQGIDAVYWVSGEDIHANAMPVKYVRQKYPREIGQGYDVIKLPVIRQAIDEAIGSKKDVFREATEAFSGYNSYGVLIISPVFYNESTHLKGVLLSVFNYDTVLSEISSNISSEEIEFVFGHVQQEKMHLTSNGSGCQSDPVNLFHSGLTLQLRYVSCFDTLFLYYVLGGSLFFVYLFSIFLLIITGYVTHVEKNVEQKTAELLESRNFLRLVMDSIPDLVFVKNRKSEIVIANQTFLNLYKPEERGSIIGRTGLELFPPEDQEAYLAEDRAAFEKGYSEVYEDNQDYTGRIKRLFTKKEKFTDARGNEYILGIGRDMTEFLVTQNKLQSIFDNTVDGLLALDHNGRIESYNKACENILGYSCSDAIGLSVKVLEPEKSMLKPTDVAFRVENHILKADEREKGQEVYIRHSKGYVLPVYIAAIRIIVGGRVIYSAIIRDISEKKKAEEELRRSNRELESFAYVASHDLQAPLRHIMMTGEILQNSHSEELPVRTRELLNIMVSSSVRMSEMLKSLLAYARVGHGHTVLESVDVANSIKIVQEILALKISQTGAEIILKTEMPVVKSTPSLNVQMFQNLIENSIKYQPKGQKPVITISAKVEAGFAYIRVEDNGIGIPAKYKNRIFMIFQRLHADNEFEGTGVGLSVCKRIAEYLGGEINLDTEFSGGTCFVIKLPLAK